MQMGKVVVPFRHDMGVRWDLRGGILARICRFSADCSGLASGCLRIFLIDQGPIEIGRNARLGAFFLVKRWFQTGVKITPHEFMEHKSWVFILPTAEEVKPF